MHIYWSIYVRWPIDEAEWQSAIAVSLKLNFFPDFCLGLGVQQIFELFGDPSEISDSDLTCKAEISGEPSEKI